MRLLYMIPGVRPAPSKCQETNLSGMQNLRPLMTEKHQANPAPPRTQGSRNTDLDTNERDQGFQVWPIPL